MGGSVFGSPEVVNSGQKDNKTKQNTFQVFVRQRLSTPKKDITLSLKR